MNASPLLRALTAAGALRTLDHAFAQSLRRLDPDTPDAVLAAAALASRAVADGHAGFDPAQPAQWIDANLDWPAPEAWLATLAASRWVAQPAAADAEAVADAPLVLEHGLLYLRRYREYERRLALGLRRIGAHAPDPGDLAALAPLFHELFPASSPPHATVPQGAEEGAVPLPTEDLQARAAALALRHALLLVTGGPGTGKTTTIARLLVLLAAQAAHAGRPAPRIALAAPTGRAAERMAESLRNAAQALPALGIDAALAAQLPTAGTTLHRLLGVIPDSPRFRHHADNPLPFDVVVVDEASMIDLPLMAKLVEAVADGARLVLLGDPDQLPSVEAGDVLSSILRAAGDGARLVHDDADILRPLLGDSSREGGNPATSGSPTDAGNPAFPGRHVHLRRGYRQSAALQLAPLAAAVRAGDAQGALALLRGGMLDGVHFHEDLADPLLAHRDAFLAHWRALADADAPAQALALAGRLRLLTAVREGPQGARNLNARIETLLAEGGLAGGPRRGAGSDHFHGRLLLVTENSYRHRLFNGDIGVCLRDGSGALAAWFPGDDPQHPRPFHPAALPAHESAFAMTVHKAQGSEFDSVWLILPERFNRALSRELVYTGMTRARSALHVAASADVLAEALARHASRWSGLGERLRE
ncbi:exodeoxyribonuclease V subunit alpha [Pseudoxanthomonas mexicana]|uniref:exodeoxyribonuclease V subunit alpha n=1 Tax=Pseudoxanthomonas mexicana TaxID=128785 RepID=UPI00398A7BE6